MIHNVYSNNIKWNQIAWLKVFQERDHSRVFHKLNKKNHLKNYNMRGKWWNKIIRDSLEGLKCTDLKSLENSSPYIQVKTACTYIKDNWNECKKELLHMISSIQMDLSKENVVSDEVHERLVTYLSESIDNLSLHIDGKSKQCRYSSHAVNIAMCLL